MIRRLRVALPLSVTLCSVLVLASIGVGGPVAHGSQISGNARLATGSEDVVAKAYYRLLLENTKYTETLWNESEGSYGIENWDVVSTVGNAALLKFGTYDESVAGVDKETLRDHTVKSIAKAVARNKFVDPLNGTWGAQIYWSATMEAYLADAARLMWDDLDETTRTNVDTMVRGEANYLATVGANPTDPAREGGTTNGLIGGYLKDTKMEEMGARTLNLSAADAYLPQDPNTADWRTWLDRWSLNQTGLPVSDRNNPTPISGNPVSEWNTAQNIFDTFTSENHDTWNGMYQQSPSAYAGRNVPRYLITGRPIPESQVTLPNNDEITTVLNRLGTSQGVPVEHMIADRQHLYGRSVLPVAYRAMVNGDRLAARAERMLIEALKPYVAWPPIGRLIKSNEGTKYETEARVEVAYAYLLHYYRDQLAGDVRPVTTKEYFAKVAGVSDFGTESGAQPGYVAHQTGRSLSLVTTKPGWVKFGFLPEHDDWFVNLASKSPSFLPSVAAVDAANARTYTKVRDGVDATASVVRRGAEYAGYTTLPSGEVVYASTGTGDDEGYLRLFNLEMPGMPGLDGNRTFVTKDGQKTLQADNVGRGGTEILNFPATKARYLRMVGVQAQSQWGYSMYEFSAYSPGSDTNLALGKTATASTFFGDASTPDKAIDGVETTRWANSRDERPTMKGWWAVDLGADAQVDRVKIHWQEDAWPLNYRIEASSDGQTWRTVSSIPRFIDLQGNWLNVDGRVGFVVRGSDNPIAAAPSAIALSHGPASGSKNLVVQGYPEQSPAATAEAARAPQPTSDSSSVRAALNGRSLSLFNLGGAGVSASVSLPQSGSSRFVYLGTQELTASGSLYRADLGASSAAVETPRFVATGNSLAGLKIEVTDSRAASVTNPTSRAVIVALTSTATGESKSLTVPPGRTIPVSFSIGIRTPTTDLARGRITYPASPLPAGMSDPDLAVDANPLTAWTPGASNRRMVVNLGAIRTVSNVAPAWTTGRNVPSYEIKISDDGLSWKPFTSGTAARYVALEVGKWDRSYAGLASLQTG